MTQEEKELLLKDLCARLTYGVKITNENHKLHIPFVGIDAFETDNILVHAAIPNVGFHLTKNIEDIRHYLRPMSSMTEEEKQTHEMFFNEDGLLDTSIDVYIDWLNEHHFDYRGLIERGLALEAPEDMYDENC